MAKASTRRIVAVSVKLCPFTSVVTEFSGISGISGKKMQHMIQMSKLNTAQRFLFAIRVDHNLLGLKAAIEQKQI